MTQPCCYFLFLFLPSQISSLLCSVDKHMLCILSEELHVKHSKRITKEQSNTFLQILACPGSVDYVGSNSLLHNVTNLYALAMHHANSIVFHARKPSLCTQIHSLTTKQPKMPNNHNPISHLILLYLTSFCIQTPNTMNSALTLVSFQSPSFNLKQRPPSRHEQISANWGTRQQRSPKPIRAILGSNATGGLGNAYRGGNTLPSSPLIDVIQEFYSSINDKDIKRLKKLLGPDCVVEHASYYKPLDVKDTHTYFTKLMSVMRKNVKFAIDEVCPGVEPTVAVMWHLEWNGRIIPFTKGCSFYMCSANGQALLIRKVHIFNESPLKPGKPALEILLFVAILFDTLPKEAEAFLQNPEALVRSIVKLYKFCLEPFVVYLLAYYIRLWSFVAQGLTMVLAVLYNIFKRFM